MSNLVTFRVSCVGIDGKEYVDHLGIHNPLVTLPIEKLERQARWVALNNGFSGQELKVYRNGIKIHQFTR